MADSRGRRRSDGSAGPVFDASLTMIQAAILGAGVALAPPAMFARDIVQERLVQPFPDDVGHRRLLACHAEVSAARACHDGLQGLAAWRGGGRLDRKSLTGFSDVCGSSSNGT